MYLSRHIEWKILLISQFFFKKYQSKKILVKLDVMLFNIHYYIDR